MSEPYHNQTGSTGAAQSPAILAIVDRLRQAVADAAAAVEAEEKAKNSYGSIFEASRKKKLAEILAELEGGCPQAQLLQKTCAEAERLAALERQEEHCPTFDWYGEHTWEMAYSGGAAACRQAAAILAGEEPGSAAAK